MPLNGFQPGHLHQVLVADRLPLKTLCLDVLFQDCEVNAQPSEIDLDRHLQERSLAD